MTEPTALRTLTDACGDWFVDEKLNVSAARLICCTFIRCELHAETSVELTYQCTFDNCTLTGTWPEPFDQFVEGEQPS